MTITTTRKLLTNTWTQDVDNAENAIEAFHSDSWPANDCRVVFFEIAGDDHLHVNVTHKKRTPTESGWAGPASVPEGFVHNRRFGYAQARGMVRHIRNVVTSAQA